mmetsp:Transcript_14652/g.23881  ORF Transcript_14652/g.23881 Transcript_14652/m.23881 type:complete len:81 (+) Transcript_14652:2306-2548(+)
MMVQPVILEWRMKGTKSSQTSIPAVRYVEEDLDACYLHCEACRAVSIMRRLQRKKNILNSSNTNPYNSNKARIVIQRDQH